jgi:hypothetical protein
MSEFARSQVSPLTSVHNLTVVKIVNGFEHLLDGLGSIFLRKFALVTDSIEQFTASS